MKKVSTGFIAIVLAFGAVAFTKASAPKSTLVTEYWFEVDGSGNPITEPSLVTDPTSFGCDNTSSILCAKAYSQVTHDASGYHAAGMLLDSFNKTR